jgi:adenylate cyclase
MLEVADNDTACMRGLMRVAGRWSPRCRHCLGGSLQARRLLRPDTYADNCFYRLNAEPAVSPGSVPARSQPYASRADIAPWDDPGPSPMEQVGDRGRNEFPLHPASNTTPAIKRQGLAPNAIPSWANSKVDGRQMPSSVFGGYFGDSSDNLGQVSPGCAPPGGMGFPGDGEDRRPSIASATTVSSQGSKGSMGGKFSKKLQGFFGEDVGNDPLARYGYSRQNSETSSLQNIIPAFAPGGSRNRNNSMNDAMLRESRPPSPGSSRPRSPAPAPSSEVTPWVFQDPQVRIGRLARLLCSEGD